MRWLKTVIARLKRSSPPADSLTASPIQDAGPVSPEPTPQTGSDCSVEAIKHQPAKPAVKRVRKPAAKTKPVAKRTRAKAPAQTPTASRSGGRGR